jgi:type III secretory pathway lipoprotein EscJ
MMRRLTWVLVPVLALAACKAKTATISKADYQAKANAICATMNAKGNSLQDPGTDQAKLKQVVDQAIPITSDGLAQLRQLPQPKGDEATIQSFFAKLDKLIADLRDESAALQANDLPKASQIATNFKTDSTAANDAANAYGLTVCGAG